MNEDKTSRYENIMGPRLQNIFGNDMDMSFFVHDAAEEFRMEEDFFTQIYEFIKHLHPDIPKVYFSPQQQDIFQVGIQPLSDGIAYCIDYLMLRFVSDFCCSIMALVNYENTEELPREIQDKKIREYKNYIVAILHVYGIRSTQLIINDTYCEMYTLKTEFLLLGTAMARGIISFLTCHEFAHILCGHYKKELKSHDDELEADYLAFNLCAELANEPSMQKYLTAGTSRAPLVLFDMMELVDYFRTTILNEDVSVSSHPSPVIRKGALLSSSAFSWAENAADNYLLFHETLCEMKYYIYEHCEAMKKNIQGMK